MLLKYYGFTLIELATVLAIIGILAIIALPSYSSYAKHGRRVDGIDTILAISLAQERYRTSHTQYGTLAQVWGGVSVSPEGYYSLSISNVSSTGYTITATAQGTQANDSESGTSCASLALTSNSGTLTKTPTSCWPQ